MTDLEERLRKVAILRPADAPVLLAAADVIHRIGEDVDALRRRLEAIDVP